VGDERTERDERSERDERENNLFSLGSFWGNLDVKGGKVAMREISLMVVVMVC
jgi:hypothetical protein